MQITFHGAARGVTGSRHLIEVNGARILLDCGLFQGRRSEADEHNRNFGFDPAGIDAVILSHAHIDHSGAVPALVKHGFDGTVHATLASTDLCVHMLRDSAFLQEKDAEFVNKREARKGRRGPPREPLYTIDDAERAFTHFTGQNYYRRFPVVPGVHATFHDAGHILGSAIVELEIEEHGRKRSIVFSGDLGRAHLPIIRDPDQLETPDVLIMESTYGDRDHSPIEEAEGALAEILNKLVARRGKLIIPAFAVGRTQEIVYAFARLFEADRIPRVPIYVDSPLAVHATEVFHRHPECFDEETRALLRQSGDPFGLRLMHYVHSLDESRALNEKEGPFVVISASGMMEGGRVLHHLRNSISDARNGILIVGYQAEHTLGRRILDGTPSVNIFGEPHDVRAEIFVMNEFSAHADRRELVAWMNGNRGRPSKIFLVHGEEAQSLALAERLEKEGFAAPQVPSLHETAQLGTHPPKAPLKSSRKVSGAERPRPGRRK